MAILHVKAAAVICLLLSRLECSLLHTHQGQVSVCAHTSINVCTGQQIQECMYCSVCVSICRHVCGPCCLLEGQCPAVTFLSWAFLQAMPGATKQGTTSGEVEVCACVFIFLLFKKGSTFVSFYVLKASI